MQKCTTLWSPLSLPPPSPFFFYPMKSDKNPPPTTRTTQAIQTPNARFWPILDPRGTAGIDTHHEWEKASYGPQIAPQGFYRFDTLKKDWWPWDLVWDWEPPVWDWEPPDWDWTPPDWSHLDLG